MDDTASSLPAAEAHRPAAKLPLPSSVPCDQCSGSMHRRERVFECERCGRTLTVSTVARTMPRADLTEG